MHVYLSFTHSTMHWIYSVIRLNFNFRVDKINLQMMTVKCNEMSIVWLLDCHFTVHYRLFSTTDFIGGICSSVCLVDVFVCLSVCLLFFKSKISFALVCVLAVLFSHRFIWRLNIKSRFMVNKYRESICNLTIKWSWTQCTHTKDVTFHGIFIQKHILIVHINAYLKLCDLTFNALHVLFHYTFIGCAGFCSYRFLILTLFTFFS